MTQANDTPAEDAIDTASFQDLGFLVLRRFFNPEPLAKEIDRVLKNGFSASSAPIDYTGIRFQYVPMMTAETPASLALLDQAADVAANLLGGPVVPTRAKAVRYFGSTPWHQDALQMTSIGFAAYLEPLAAESGAFRVIPGSHNGHVDPTPETMGQVLVTEPGDMIVFDEKLFHCSSGGKIRRQWRVDYLPVPVDDAAARFARSYFAELYAPDWDGGYDAERYPSYGPDWRSSGRAAVAQLEALGVYDLADRQESFMRSKRRETTNRGKQ